MTFQAFPSVSGSRHLEKVFTGVTLTLALHLVTPGMPGSVANSAEVPENPVTPNAPYRSNPHSSPKQAHSLKSGTYLYGQSSSAEQLGSAYLVFEVKENKVVGAFYMPRSSFDCFHGTLQADRLALTVVDSYEKVSYPYSVALRKESVSASAGKPVATAVELSGFRHIKRLSSGDQKILSTCKANYRL
ncbi:hypothetical protein [Leptothermofonsia sp. ETS-13]|uniref:hypothetical protein n=1 Tax=Leptothermofonsia sp. ETS-13 TaxID=3035696 RepID=UPI003B9FC689